MPLGNMEAEVVEVKMDYKKMEDRLKTRRNNKNEN